MLEPYLAGAALTGVYLYAINAPEGAGEWVAWLAFVIAWPLVFVSLAFVALMNRFDRH